MIRRTFILFSALAVSINLSVFSVHLSVNAQQKESGEMQGLSDIYAPGFILQDRNGDSVIDFVHVRILLPRDAGEAEIVAAANMASRLGYETSAMNLDLVEHVRSGLRYDIPVLLIGNDGEWSGFLSRERLSRLSPGQGAITFIGPNNFFRKGAVHIGGADASGLIAAAGYAAGRMPDLWKLKAKTTSDVRSQFKTFFEQREFEPADIRVDGIVIDGAVPGVTSLRVNAGFPDTETLNRAVQALKGDEETPQAGERIELKDLEFADVHHIVVTVSAEGEEKSVDLKPSKPWNTTAPKGEAKPVSRDFSLWQLYSTDGVFVDANKDYVPDDIAAYIALSGTEDARGVTNVAARLGLESAGVRIPVVRVSGEGTSPEKIGFPMLSGTDHPLIEKLLEDGKLYGVDSNSRKGYIQFVSNAYGNKNCIVVGGGSAEGFQAVNDYTAKRLPYLWDYGKGKYHLRDVEKDVGNFFRTRKGPGQSAAALYKLESWLDRIKEKNIESIAVEIAAEDVPAGLDNFAGNIVREKFPAADIDVNTFKTGFGLGKNIFTEEFDVPWEVDEFREIFRAEILPEISAESTGLIRLRVSESPEMRRELKSEIENQLKAAGVRDGAVEVVVLSAYKQGYSWIYDEILPKIRGENTGRIEISYHHLKDSDEIPWQAIHADTRWLQELYPVDAVLSRELGIPDSLISFHPTIKSEPVYNVRVYDTRGRQILEESFSPKYTVRPYFDLFPEYDNVRVTTGWISAGINGRVVADRRIKTDPERFWDHFQNETYQKLINYTMDVQDGQPSSDNAPYFDEFRVYITMSEPNYRIGIGEEVISSTEALHEDIYFETLVLFNLIGSRYQAGSMNYPGRILPFIQPPVDGKSGHVKIELTGKERARPELVMNYTESGKESVRRQIDIRQIDVKKSRLTGIWVEPGAAGPSKLMFEVSAVDSVDRYDEYKMRASESEIDRTFIAAEKLSGMVDILHDMHDAGLFTDALSYDKVGSMLFRFVLEDSSDFSLTNNLPRSRNPKDTRNPELIDRTHRPGERIVHWEAPIGPDEAAAMMAKLNTYPKINTYYMTTSFLGQNVYAMDVLSPFEAEFISQAKLNALKPTLIVSGRQHANEVSSTSHILRLAELIATTPDYDDYIKKVNLVLHPITNIDGALLAIEMQRTNPDFMLHAGYLGPLGVDVDSDSRQPQPRYPESSVRGMLRDTWLPDIFLNPHGYPSHEWVQYFAGYSAWVRGRNVRQRSWWSPRGWFIPGFRWIDDPKHPDIKTAQFAILDSITTAVGNLPDVMQMNNNLYSRYRKYGIQDRENFKEYFHNGILANVALRGRKVSGNSKTGSKVTCFSMTTEAPDETARGEWLQLLCQAGLAHETAALRYLASGKHRIRHEAKEYKDTIMRSFARKRPVLPVDLPGNNGRKK